MTQTEKEPTGLWPILRCARWDLVVFYALVYGVVTLGLGAIVVACQLVHQARQIEALGPISQLRAEQWDHYLFFRRV